MNDTQSARRQRQIAVWLLAVCALIFTMVVVGGVTRLTRSGLSIVEWKPVTGVIPPLTESAWQEAFAKYRQYPEYQKINRGMSLAEFKNIYWWEFAHRLLGRLIGLAFLLPYLYFLWRGVLRGPLAVKTGVMFLLGGLQGLLGWYMVQSGLVDRPHVSPYRLTAHLLFAVTLYGYMLWVALDLLGWARRRVSPGLRRGARAVLVLVVLMIATGGFVAGTKAGFAFNTFPLMNGRWIPEGYLALEPVWHNFAENIATVQFNHRWLAIVTGLAVLALWWRGLGAGPEPGTRLRLHALAGLTLVQIGLGLATLLTVVPVALGAAHQGGALVVFSAALILNHRLRA